MVSARLVGLSIVLPSYNEQDNVASVVKDAVRVGSEITSACEVIVVDDGSRDATGRVAKALSEAMAEVTVITHDTNRGYGAALRTGFEHARHGWVAYADADGQFDLTQLQRLAAATVDHDLVTGVRRLRRDGVFRAWLGRAWTGLSNQVLGADVIDVNCGFKLLPTAFVQGTRWTSNGAAIGAELMSEARNQGLVIGQVLVDHRPRLRGRQSGARVPVMLRALVEMTSLWWRRLNRKRGFGRAPWPGRVFRRPL